MFGKKKEISTFMIGEFDYSPAQIARRVGVSVNTIKTRLEKTGLIDRCYRDEKGWLRIPHSVALDLIGEQAMQIQLTAPATQKRRQPVRKGRRQPLQEQFVEDEFSDRDYSREPVRLTPAQQLRERQEYAEELAGMMLRAGITPKMLYAQVAKNFEEYKRRQNANLSARAGIKKEE